MVKAAILEGPDETFIHIQLLGYVADRELAIDLESYRRWWDYTKATDDMLAGTDTEYAPWYVVRSDDKRRARLNCIAHLLSVIPWKKLPYDKPSFPKRKKKPANVPENPCYRNFVPEYGG